VRTDSVYHLLDATEDFYPFGLLPERCLNGKGRVFASDSSYWVDLNPSQRDKQVTIFKMSLDEEGSIKGDLATTYTGYAAVRVREQISAYSSEKEYFDQLTKNLIGFEINATSLENLYNISNPLIQNIKFSMQALDEQQRSFLINPFPIGKWSHNPFKSNERFFPVDFGAPLEEIFVVEFSYPDNFEIANIPEKLALGLPNNGGRFIVDPKPGDNKLTFSVFLSIVKPVYTSVEYHYLKELFSRIVQVHQTDLLVQRIN
jgi:hypothetical protein